MRGFLWSHSSLKKGRSKVAWEVVCLLKNKGGLGIRRLEVFHSALMIAHVWKLLSLKESLWVKWIHEYKLKGRSFWEIPVRGNMTWGWRKILHLRPTIRDFIWCNIGDGAATSLWFDKCWPQELLSKYPCLSACQAPIVEGRSDSLVWRNSQGTPKSFSVTQVWSDIRPRGTYVDWYPMVWFASCIPRHAFNLWLVVKRKLKTQDLVSIWDVSDSLGSLCSLCGIQPDSHDHLFFECPYASEVWDRMKILAGLDSSTLNVYAIITDLLPMASRRSILSVVAKLVIAASAYFIWQEHNWRLFKNNKRKLIQICECIQSSVRLKLLSCKLKKSKNGERMARLWELPEAVFL
ncbi:reverse transcriptase zinc-binding domain-containing protein [Tanacetum coccineum]